MYILVQSFLFIEMFYFEYLYILVLLSTCFKSTYRAHITPISTKGIYIVGISHPPPLSHTHTRSQPVTTQSLTPVRQRDALLPKKKRPFKLQKGGALKAAIQRTPLQRDGGSLCRPWMDLMGSKRGRDVTAPRVNTVCSSPPPADPQRARLLSQKKSLASRTLEREAWHNNPSNSSPPYSHATKK